MHTEAVNSVAKTRDVGPSTVRDKCTRQLGLDTQQFVEYVKNDQIIQILKEKYPNQIELINELEGLP